MPIFASLIMGLMGNLALFLVKFVGVKTAVGLAAVAVYGGCVITLLTLLRVTIAALVPVIGDNNFAVGIALAIPPNASACLTAWFTMWTACTLYTWKVKALNLMK